MQCILFLLTSPAPYGAEHSILSNINYLVKKKKIKPIFIIRNNGVLEKYLIKKKYQYFIIPFFFFFSIRKYNLIKAVIKLILNIFFAFFVFVKLKNKKIDTVYTNCFTTHFGILISILLGSKHIFHIRELGEKWGYKFDFSKKIVMYFSNKYSNKIFVNSEFLYNRFKNTILREKLKIIPNPIDDKFVNVNKFSFKDRIKIIYIGRLEAEQNPLSLTIIASKLIKYNFKIDVYGEGSLKEKLKEKIIQKNLSDFIKIKNYKLNINKILNNYNIGLSLGKHQTFNRTIIEFMKSGIVVLANKSGNNINIINNNYNGYLIPLNNVSLIQKKLKDLFSNQSLIKKIGNRAFRSYKFRFTVKESSEILLKILYEK